MKRKGDEAESNAMRLLFLMRYTIILGKRRCDSNARKSARIEREVF